METYNNLEITDFTKQKRNQIRSLQDEFMTFSWRGFDAFESFGAFIINDKKGSLKFYNGPGFSNEYTKPQFEANAGELMGVTFNRNVISFTIGIYWISIEHYRLLLNWLDPLITDYICFGFEPKFRYNVKLSKIGDSTRWVVGKENGKPMYYTELNLSFEVQGVQCAKGMNAYEWSNWTVERESRKLYATTSLNTDNDFIASDLPTPLEISNTFSIESENAVDLNSLISYDFKLEAKTTKETVVLYEFALQNLTHNFISDSDILTLNIRFNSETGLLFLKIGNSTEKLLNLLTTNDSGQRIVQFFNSSKFLLPGEFNYPNFYNENNISLKLTITKTGGSDIIPEGFIKTTSIIVCYPRTNII